MAFDPDGVAPFDESDIEWERLRGFVQAGGAPLALIEVESGHQAEQVLRGLERLCPDCRLRVFRVGADMQPGLAIDWLTDQQGDADARSVFLVLMDETVRADEERARVFWTWAGAQRERWRPLVGKLAFILTPAHVNDLARHADALWDWIPLKFNLLRAARAARLDRFASSRADAAVERYQTAAGRESGERPLSARQRIDALRQQLLEARARGLAESIVRREYAWPLLQALVEASRLRDAETVVTDDLGGDFAAELPPQERATWFETLGYLHLDLWHLGEAEQAFRALEQVGVDQSDEAVLARAYFGIGRCRAEARRFEEANEWYRQAAAISEKLGIEDGAASTYHQLGVVAQTERNLAAADRWYRKALAIKERRGNEQSAASTYHNLGMIAHEHRRFATAEKRYRKALAIFEKLGDAQGTASAYHELARIAQERRDFPRSEELYRRSLAIRGKLGDEHGAAMTYGQLGTLALEHGDLDAAEQWCRMSLTVTEKLGDEYITAKTYHQLGRIAQERRELAAAEQWYRRSLAITEKVGDEHGAAKTYGQLGILASLQERFEESGQWLMKCCAGFANCNDADNVQQAATNFMVLYRQAPPDARAKLAAMWREAGLGELPQTPGGTS